MRKNNLLVSTVVFSGALAIGSGAAWSQDSGMQKQGSGQRMESGGRSQWSQQDVRQVQEALKEKGHNPGAIDGIMGPRTQAALRQFQRAQNIQATGQLDSSTASALGVSMSSSGATSGTDRSGASMGSPSRGQRDAGSPSSESREGTGPGSPEGRTKDGSLPGAPGASTPGSSKSGTTGGTGSSSGATGTGSGSGSR